MKPLNSAERTTAFFRFLLLFLVTAALLVAVVFCSLQVRSAENDRLRQAVWSLQSEKELSDSFGVVMQEAVADLNRYGEKSESPEATNHRIQNKIAMMNALLVRMHDGENSLYALMIQNLSELSSAKKILSQEREQ